MKNQQTKRTETLLPILAEAFAEMGYRRATTAKLAQRCQVKEAILYRLWQNKKEMFAASLSFIADNILKTWESQIDAASASSTPIETLLSYESKHFAEYNNYLIIFSALNETDDSEIKQSLQRMYFRIHSKLVEYISRHQAKAKVKSSADTSVIAWALMGIGTMATIAKHLGMLNDADRGQLLTESGHELLG